MTTDAVPPAGDPRRLLSDVRTLAHRVRLDQRVTWVALLVLAAVTFAAIPIDWYSLYADCGSASAWINDVDGSSMCHIRREGAMFYWPLALLLAYTAIAVYAVRVTRARGLGARVLPYALTGVALTVLFTAAWLLARLYLANHPVPTDPLPGWALLLDRLIAPAGTIGVALLVLARLERNVALLAFALGYLAVVLLPINEIWHPDWGYRGILGEFLPHQIINGVVLLLGAVGFAVARLRHR
ncbi:hypothetical protein PSN13_04933 [Micromonospora saelicesensis]|uniref:DUF998 domain-containing protein n=1 Tax=Micromonospora saelicesensis TaxID=285676 RepID=A0A328NNM5_9ACTN|nr:hypothetical protein [Micromonospora saelicesensis]RAO29734.1 hypothetical protein PSN13_04933 [Micromonospora saelicesensis]